MTKIIMTESQSTKSNDKIIYVYIYIYICMYFYHVIYIAQSS